MQTVENARAAHEDAHAEAVRLSNEYESTRAAVKEEYDPQVKEANQRLVEAEKALNDAEVMAALAEREDGEALAASLGLTLPSEDEVGG